MDLTKVTERIYYLINDRETDRPVLGYIKGDKYSLMVDAGNSSPINKTDIIEYLESQHKKIYMGNE